MYHVFGFNGFIQQSVAILCAGIVKHMNKYKYKYRNLAHRQTNATH